MIKIFCTLLPTCALVVGILSDPEVETTLGKIRGFQEEVNGALVNTFLGVPFAKPPVGKLRFQPPLPAEAWDETLETKAMGYSCPQILSSLFPNNKGESMWNAKTELREDCLYLNVWVPNEHHFTESFTTMVWIFGGGFVSGSTALDVYEGKYLAARNDIIVVSIGYRLGPFGFLYLGDSNAPGNMGLLDQTLALKWIYDNIEKFGGSEKKISLFGESAGAASVHYHTLSPMSKPFFSSVIMQSASALSDWAYQPPSEIFGHSVNLAINLGCYNSSDTGDIVECLQSKSTEQLATEQWFLNFNAPTFTTFPFVPTVDGSFLTDTPINLVLNRKYAKVPMLLGVNRNEASFYILYDLVQAASRNNSVSIEEALPYIPSEVTKRENFLRYIPRLVDIKMNPVVLKSILHEYDTTPPSETKQQNINILDSIGGDYAFKCPTISVAKEAASDITRSPTQGVYLYSFEHRTCTNPWPAWAGVLHGDEIEFIFGMPLKDGAGYTKDEKELSGKIMDYITNFAKTGNPNTAHLQTEDKLMSKVLRGGANLAKQFVEPDVIIPHPRDSVNHENIVESLDVEPKDEQPEESADLDSEIPPTPVLEVRRPVRSTDVHWPKYTALEERYIVFGDGQSITASFGLKHRECMFWGRLYPDLKKATEVKCPVNS